MFFKTFTLDADIEKKIAKAGFSVNSYEEYSVYSGTENTFTSHLPKNYISNGVLWEKIDSSELFERTCLLVKTPYLSFDELWNLFVRSKQDADSMGALVLMYKQYYPQLRQKQNTYIGVKEKLPKLERRALKELSRVLR
jgi:hypothetical protein